MIATLLVWMSWFLSGQARRGAETLYRDYHVILRRRCRKLLRDDVMVDDAMQDIFWTICRSYDNYRGEPDQILPWLYRITTTHCLKMLEKNKRWHRNVEEAVQEGVERYQSSLGPQEMEIALTVHQLLDKVPSQQRQAILHRYVSGMTQREIAEVMKVTRDQVRTWLSRFQERAEQWLESSTLPSSKP